MKQLLLLCWGLLAVVSANPSPLQSRALEMVLDEFHNRSHVKFVFKQESMVDSVEGLPVGTFIHLEVDLAQTVCWKRQRGMPNCRIKAGGRKQTCLACFKFAFSGNVLDQSVRCLSQQVPVFQEVKKRQAKECEHVKQTGEEHYQPGVFAFSKGLPILPE